MGTDSTDPTDPKIGVDFIDILFGVAAGEVFIGLGTATADEVPRIGHFAVALAVITFSWLGYHKAKNARPRDVRFDQPLIVVQFVVDILIVGSYFILVRSAEKIRPGHVTLVPEFALLAGVFGLYVLWDALDLALGSRPARRRVWNSVGAAVVFAAAALLFRAAEPTATPAVLAVDGAAIVGLYAYRFLQEPHWHPPANP